MQFSEFREIHMDNVIKNILIAVICWFKPKITEVDSLNRSFFQHIEHRLPETPIIKAIGFELMNQYLN